VVSVAADAAARAGVAAGAGLEATGVALAGATGATGADEPRSMPPAIAAVEKTNEQAMKKAGLLRWVIMKQVLY
jgi:hypothetical protein